MEFLLGVINGMWKEFDRNESGRIEKHELFKFMVHFIRGADFKDSL